MRGDGQHATEQRQRWERHLAADTHLSWHHAGWGMKIEEVWKFAPKFSHSILVFWLLFSSTLRFIFVLIPYIAPSSTCRGLGCNITLSRQQWPTLAGMRGGAQVIMYGRLTHDFHQLALVITMVAELLKTGIVNIALIIFWQGEKAIVASKCIQGEVSVKC